MKIHKTISYRFMIPTVSTGSSTSSARRLTIMWPLRTFKGVMTSCRPIFTSVFKECHYISAPVTHISHIFGVDRSDHLLNLDRMARRIGLRDARSNCELVSIQGRFGSGAKVLNTALSSHPRRQLRWAQTGFLTLQQKFNIINCLNGLQCNY